MHVDDFLARLDHVKPRGKDKWLARCPAHDDRDPSLSVAISSGGNILVRCFAGCEPISIVESVGFRLSDLFDKPLDYEPPHPAYRREAADKKRVENRLDQARLVIALAESDRIEGKKQSADDRKRELRAVETLIRAGVEYDASIILLQMQERLR